MRTRTRTDGERLCYQNKLETFGPGKICCVSKPLQRGREDVAAGVARSTFLVNYDATDAREKERGQKEILHFLLHAVLKL